MIRPPAAIVGGVAQTPPSQKDLDKQLCHFPLTEFGLAERFIARYGDRFCYVEGWRKWLYFDGKRWIPTQLAAERFAQQTILALKREANHLEIPNDNPKAE